MLDAHGNGFRYSGRVYTDAGSTVGATAWDVWLTGTKPTRVVQPARDGGAEPAGPDGVDPLAGASQSDACDDGGGQTPTSKPNLKPLIGVEQLFGFGWNIWPSFDVCNVGTKASDAFHVSVEISGPAGPIIYQIKLPFDGLAAGECRSRPDLFAFTTVIAGDFWTTVSVDTDYQVTESSEYDNRAYSKLKVRP